MSMHPQTGVSSPQGCSKMTKKVFRPVLRVGGVLSPGARPIERMVEIASGHQPPSVSTTMGLNQLRLNGRQEGWKSASVGSQNLGHGQENMRLQPELAPTVGK